MLNNLETKRDLPGSRSLIVILPNHPERLAEIFFGITLVGSFVTEPTITQ